MRCANGQKHKNHINAFYNGMIGVSGEISEVYSSLSSNSMIIALSGTAYSWLASATMHSTVRFVQQKPEATTTSFELELSSLNLC